MGLAPIRLRERVHHKWSPDGGQPHPYYGMERKDEHIT